MRKRAELKSRSITYEPKHITESKPKKFDKISKNWWVTVALISIFFLVLFFNTYFNFTSGIAINSGGEGYSKYLLSGPDPYYNLRLVEGTNKTGIYPYYTSSDPLLNYPLGRSGGRAPLLNMIALGFSNFLKPFMNEVDAIGYSVQFVPALFGALIIFPVFFIGKTIFNKKAGLIAAFFIAIIPIHIGSGHGSAFSLFDHDSLNLLLFFLTFLFFILSLKVKEKDHTKSILYAILAGVPLAGLSLVWVEAEELYVIIAIYVIVQIIIDIFLNKIEINIFRTASITLLTGYLISLPVTIVELGGVFLNTSLLMTILVVGFGFLYYLFGVRRIPWTLSLPFIFISGAVGLVFFYFINHYSIVFNFLPGLNKISSILFGTGIYGNKVSMTIAEANDYAISQTVMNIGPALYWVAVAGFILLLWYYYRDKLRRDYLFLIVMFIIDMWLTHTAGRFLNDIVPLIAILSGFIIWFVVDKIDYKQLVKNIRGAGGGLHGLRRSVKIMHIFGIVLIAFIVIFPNAFLVLDAAIPSKAYPLNENKTKWDNWKQDYFLNKNYSGVFGLSVYKEGYWVNAFDWLAKQDLYNINGTLLNDKEKPAFISWWDYGFYEAAIGKHPTVADNFQDGIPAAANFHTATSEKDAVTVLIVRLLEGNLADGKGKLSENVKEILAKYLSRENADNVSRWMENPTSSPSYHSLIDEEFNKYIRGGIDTNLLKVGDQWSTNAVYHDVIELFNNNTNGLTEEKVTWLYHDIQEATGYSIRYYGVEGYDRQIFNIFAFLSDKSLVLLGAPEDKFVTVLYSGYEVKPSGGIDHEITNEPFINYLNLSNIEKRYVAVTGQSYSFKDPYYNTMFYRTYIGPTTVDSTTGQKSMYDWQVPCLDMKHFYAEFISNMTNPFLQYPGTNKAAVVIAKYYEGALINGSVYFQGKPISINVSVVVRKNLSYAAGNNAYNTPIDYDRYEIIKDKTSNFSLIAGGGAYISVIRNPELRFYDKGILPFNMQWVIFNGENGTDYAPISDADAMRKTGSNFERTINITIHPANVSGYVYDNLDGISGYNKTTSDKPLNNTMLLFYGIEKFNESQIANGMLVPDVVDNVPNQVFTNESGYYNVSGLLPGYYALNVYDGPYLIHQEIVPFRAGNNTLDIARPINSSVSGTAYYNNDDNSSYNPGVDEKISNATIDLIYYSNIYNNYISIKNTTTDSKGYYSFKDIVPGDKYIIKAVKGSEYESIQQLQVKENTTQTFNISMSLTPINVSGYTKYLSTPVGGATVTFNKDLSVSKNTAVNSSATTNATTGYYTVSLQPGTYNITVKKETTTLEYYLDGEKLTIIKGQVTASKDLSLNKKSVTVTGKIIYGGSGVYNVTINFVNDSSLANNTAMSSSVKSDINGAYNIELTPGSYVVSTSDKIVNESGVLYVYKAPNGLKLTVSETDIMLGRVFDITLLKELKS